MTGFKESRRETAHGFKIVVRGENVQPTDAVLAEVVMEMTAEVGGTKIFNMDDPATMEEMARRLRAKGVDPETGQWLC
jgi:hypothetical protein